MYKLCPDIIGKTVGHVLEAMSEKCPGKQWTSIGNLQKERYLRTYWYYPLTASQVTFEAWRGEQQPMEPLTRINKFIRLKHIFGGIT